MLFIHQGIPSKDVNLKRCLPLPLPYIMKNNSSIQMFTPNQKKKLGRPISIELSILLIIIICTVKWFKSCSVFIASKTCCISTSYWNPFFSKCKYIRKKIYDKLKKNSYLSYRIIDSFSRILGLTKLVWNSWFLL